MAQTAFLGDFWSNRPSEARKGGFSALEKKLPYFAKKPNGTVDRVVNSRYITCVRGIRPLGTKKGTTMCDSAKACNTKIRPQSTVTLLQVPGSSGRVYDIRMGKNGHIYCNCMAWKMQKGVHPSERTCKHIRQAQAEGRLPKTA